MLATAAVAHAVAGRPRPQVQDYVLWTTFLLTGLLMFSLFTGFFSGRAKAQAFRPATEAPAAWNEFAGNLRARSEAVLRSDDQVARRFRATLEKLKADGDKTAPALAVRIWIAATGQIERVSFPSFSDAAANIDLRTLLLRVSAGPPPAGMLQPVRLRLSLEAHN